MDLLSVTAVNAGVTAGLMTAVWLASLALRDVSIVDVFWGPGFAVVAGVTFALAAAPSDRAAWLVAATAVWGLRLAVHLGRRKFGTPEDPRYRAMRDRIGPRFAWVSLFLVFGLQGGLMLVISLPVVAGQLDPTPPGGVAVAGLVVWAAGMFFEAVGDYQLARFKADPANRGRVMDRGLWRYTRHPNYFGDCLVWWGLYLIAWTPGTWWTAVGPAVMTVLLVRVSGVTLLEKSLRRDKPGYAAYAARTSAFVPWPPRG